MSWIKSIFSSSDADPISQPFPAIQVDSSGKGNAEIPIELPPGTGGIVPSLSLVHTTDASRGIVGEAWELSGWEWIQRSPGDKIAFSSSDSFLSSLGGNLILTGSGTFRTYNESFILYTSSGDCSTSCTWTAIDKGGLKYTFGGNASSVLLTGTVPRFWALSKVEDPWGNSYEIQYRMTNGVLYPWKYTYGNREVEFIYTSRSGSTGAVFSSGDREAWNQVIQKIQIRTSGNTIREYRFNYENGVYGRSRLSSLERSEYSSRWGDEDYLPLSFTYTDTPANSSFQNLADYNLDSVILKANIRVPLYDKTACIEGAYWCFVAGQACPSIDMGGGPCIATKNAAIISCDGYTLNWFEPCNGGQSVATFLGTWADLNSDGKLDLQYLSGNMDTGIYPSSFIKGISGFSNYISDINIGNFQYNTMNTLAFGEANGDVRGDILISSSSTLVGITSNGTLNKFLTTYSNVSIPSPTPVPITDLPIQYQKSYSFDLNRDGRSDYLWIVDDSTINYSLSQGTGFADPVSVSLVGATSSDGTFLDLEGDGIPEFIYFSGSNLVIQSFNSTLTSFTQTTQTLSVVGQDAVSYSTAPVYAGRWWGDINGDHLPDLVAYDNGFLYVYRNEYGKLANSPQAVNIGIVDLSVEAGKNKYFGIGDLNGDGFGDFVWANGSRANVYFSTGSTLANTPSAGIDITGEVQLVDVNSDRKTDLVVMDIANNAVVGNLRVYTLSTGLPGNLLVSVSDNQFKSSTITYSWKTDLSGTISTSAGSYPNVPNANNEVIVKQIDNNLGNGVSETLAYSYTNSRLNLGTPMNRVSYGFRTVVETNSRTLEKTEIDFFQTNRLYAGMMEARRNYIGTVSGTNTVYSLVKNETQVAETGTFAGKIYSRIQSSTRKEYIGGTLVGNVSTSFSYDSCGNISTATEVNETYTTVTTGAYACDASGWILNRQTAKTVTRNGIILEKIQIAYSDFKPVSKTEFSGTSAAKTQTYDYDVYGNQVLVTDSRGNQTTIEYDPVVPVFAISITDASGLNTLKEYDTDRGLLIQEIAPNGGVTKKYYDEFGRLIQTDYPGEADWSEKLSYGITSGEQTSYVERRIRDDENGEAVTIETYTPQGWLVKRSATTLLDGWATSVKTYSAVGKLLTESNEYVEGVISPVFTTYEYNGPDGQLSKINFPDGTTKSVNYSGRTITTQIKNGSTLLLEESLTKDELDQDVTKTSNGSTIQYSYDNGGRPWKVMDPQNGTTIITYDSAGRKASITDPNSGTTSYSYDSEGNLISQTDARGKSIQKTYDSSNRMIKSTPSDGSPATVITYDGSTLGKGRPTQIQDSAGTLNLTYNIRGNISQKVRTIDDLALVFKYEYDSMGRVISTTYPDGSITHNVYSKGNHLTGIRMDVPDKGSYDHPVVSYDGPFPGMSGSFQFTRTTGNGVVSYIGYDPVYDRPTGYQTNLKNGTVSQQVALEFDSKGNIKKINDLLNVGRTQIYTYDEQNRLVQATGKYGTETYQYTDNGNLLKKGDFTYTYGNSSHVHAVTSVNSANTGTISFSYDAAGNMISRNGESLAYDANGKLIAHTLNGGDQLGMVYDFAGNRIKKTRSTDLSVIYSPDPLYEVLRRPGYADQHTLYIRGVKGELVAQFARTDATLISATSIRTQPGVTDAAFWKEWNGKAKSGLINFILGYVYNSHGKLSEGFLAFAWALIIVLGLALAFSNREESRPPAWARLVSAPMILLFSFSFSVGCLDELMNNGGSGTAPWDLLPLAVSGNTPSVDSPPGNGGTTDGGGISGTPVPGMVFFHPDHMGSIAMATNGEGNPLSGGDMPGASHISYKPYGEIDRTDSSGPDIFRYKYTSHVEDRDSGLYYYNARYYDPTIARFLQADAAIFPNRTQGFNRYMYTEGNPVRYGDASGNNISTPLAWGIIGYFAAPQFGLTREQGFLLGYGYGRNQVRHTSDLQRFANGVGAGISRAFYSPPPGSRGGWRAVLHSIDHSWRDHFHRVDHGFRTAARGVDQSLRRIGEAFMQALGKRHKDAKTAGEFYGQASLGFVGGGIWDNYKLTPELLGYVGLAEFASEVSFIGMAYSIYNVAAFTYNYYEGYGAYEEISNAAILGMFIAYYQWGFDQNPFIRAYVCTYIKEHYREARADSC
ncbi:RHS repeat-associated core domain-containing protein [Leptospira wolffii]|uniref:RHS repeat-associated core domain-containing protein n=1 Tax=Leptospira wolffii TaxID=409998 RepID=A0ABV5BKA5_9LEPT